MEYVKDENHENEPCWPCGVEMVPHIFVDKFEWSNTCVDHGHMYGSLRSIKDDQEVIFPHSKYLEKKEQEVEAQREALSQPLKISSQKLAIPKLFP